MYSYHDSRFTIQDLLLPNRISGEAEHGSRTSQLPIRSLYPRLKATTPSLGGLNGDNGRLPRRRPRRGGWLRSYRSLRRPNCLFARRLDWRGTRDSSGKERWRRAGGALLQLSPEPGNVREADHPTSNGPTCSAYCGKTGVYYCSYASQPEGDGAETVEFEGMVSAMRNAGQGN